MHTIQRLWHRMKGSPMSNLCKPISTLMGHLLISSYSHSILEPVIGKDVVHDKRVYSTRRHPFRLGVDPAFEFRCKRCPELPIYKLWEMQALMLHLRTKYLIFSLRSCNALLTIFVYYSLGMTFPTQSKATIGLKWLSSLLLQAIMVLPLKRNDEVTTNLTIHLCTHLFNVRFCNNVSIKQWLGPSTLMICTYKYIQFHIETIMNKLRVY